MPNYCKACACTGKKKVAHYGLEGGKKEWCGPCAERHGGVRMGKRTGGARGKRQREMWAHYGLQNTTKRSHAFSLPDQGCAFLPTGSRHVESKTYF